MIFTVTKASVQEYRYREQVKIRSLTKFIEYIKDSGHSVVISVRDDDKVTMLIYDDYIE